MPTLLPVPEAITSPSFVCPICQNCLIMGEKTWHCQSSLDSNQSTKQHTFDIAKQGYVNLLPVQHKKSKHPGDSEVSIAARQRFLSAGHYKVLQQGIGEFCQDLINEPISTWLDIGCGEGYYTEAFLSLPIHNLVALDISKPAVINTAKRFKASNPPLTTTYALVASAAQAPLADQSVQVISSIFSPILPTEFARLLANKGLVIIAKPGINHLIELRQALFDSVTEHNSDKFIDTLAPSFMLTKVQPINGQIHVNFDDLTDLLTMTPYSYRAKPKKRQTLLEQGKQIGTMSLTVDFVLYGFIKAN